MYVMAWDFVRTKTGRPTTDGAKIRRQVVKFHKDSIALGELAGMPMLDKVLVYNECEVAQTIWTEKRNESLVFKHGWYTSSGQFIRFNSDGQAQRSGDRTIAFLLAGIHYSLGTNFNRFFSYVDEIREESLVPYAYAGFDFWLTEDEGEPSLIRAVNSNIP